MKYLINLLFLLGAAFFLGGCSDNGDPVDTPRLEVSESSLRFGSLATEQVIQVTSSEAWKIANIPDWLSVEPVSGQAGEYDGAGHLHRAGDGESGEAGRHSGVCKRGGLHGRGHTGCAQKR